MNFIFSLILLVSLNDNPPGTIKIKGIFIDKTEIQNIHWIEFIYAKQKELDSASWQKFLPDSLNFWYTVPENQYGPIVLISYEQALAYCAWRSEVVSKRLGRKVTYRLPTTKEWKDIAEELLRTDKKGLENELEKTRKMMKSDSTKYFIGAREKNKARIYNMFDNVSEMTMESGIAMGSNNHELMELQTNLTRLIKYNAANAYLGFRCVAEIE